MIDAKKLMAGLEAFLREHVPGQEIRMRHLPDWPGLEVQAGSRKGRIDYEDLQRGEFWTLLRTLQEPEE
jgi:hypothetical protein